MTPPHQAKSDWFLISSKALIFEILLQFIIGIILATQYSPGTGGYQSVVHFRSTFFGSFVSGIHYWGSMILILHSLAQVTVTLWTAKYREYPLRWLGTVLIFLTALGAQITGNILPMDRHGVQTAVVETGLMGSIPVVGKIIRTIAVGGPTMNPATGTHWFRIHEFVITALFIIGMTLIGRGSAKFRSKSDRLLALVPIFILLLVAIAVKPPLGNPAQKLDFGEYNAYVSWYTWPMHGMLKLFENFSSSAGWIGFAVVPGLFVAFLFLVPVLDKLIKRVGIQVTFAIFAVGFLGAGFKYGGPIAALTGNRDPAPNNLATGPKRKVTPPNSAQLALIHQGQSLFNSIGCSGCHGQNGTNGSSGPNLTQLWQMHNTAWFAKYMHNPRSINPNSTMPAFSSLSATQRNQIGTFLSYPMK